MKIIISFLVVLPLACNQQPSSNPTPKENPRTASSIRLESSIAEGSGRLTTINHFTVNIVLPDSNSQVDSVVALIDGAAFKATPTTPYRYKVSLIANHIGRRDISIQAMIGGKPATTNHLTATIYSDIVPQKKRVKVLRTYPHDPGAYTQGLEYKEGKIIESTGQWNRSSVRIADLATGKVEKIASLPSEIFGEGACTFNGEIYQLTWKNGIVLVYSSETLTEKRKFNHPLTEGWGLTTNGTQLIVSDGSHRLYFVDPHSFNIERTIEVFDHERLHDSLNELEYIDDKIYANVYGRTYILVIEPSTGKVWQKIDCTSLVPQQYAGNMDKVLNGIAWNTQTGKLLLTGKEWPQLFEVEVID